MQRKAAARKGKTDLFLGEPERPKCCTSRQNPPPLGETELLSFSFDRKEKIFTPSDLTRDNIFALVERIIDNT